MSDTVVWSYNFRSADAAGTISVSFKNLQKDIAVLFRPPDSVAKQIAKSSPLVGIQVFNTKGGNDPLSKEAVEMTQFGSAANPKNNNRLVLTINYARLDETKINKLFISGMDDKGQLISSAINLTTPKGSTKKPFVYTVARAKTKAFKLILEIEEWPKGDPLISHG